MALGLILYSAKGNEFFPPGIGIWIVLSGVLHGLYILSLSRAYSSQDISYVYPIARSGSGVCPVFFLDAAGGAAWMGFLSCHRHDFASGLHSAF